jgi:hypothetical protein
MMPSLRSDAALAASARRRAHHAARAHRYPQRQAVGRACYVVEIGEAAFRMLTKYGYLAARDAADPAAVSRAISAFVEESAAEG